MTGTLGGPGDREVEVEVTLCPGGPMLLRGATHLIGADGDRHQVERPVVAVCRCGKTGRAPWCDGTHKLLMT